MPQRVQKLMSFSKFSDQNWSAVCARLPKKWTNYCHDQVMRSLLEHALTSFCWRHNFPPGTHAITVDEKSDIVKIDLVERHRLIAATARAFSEAYDPSLNVDDNLKPEDNPGDHIKWVKTIAKSHARAAQKLERESRSSAGRGRKRDKALDYLINNLIRAWHSVGGEIASSNHGHGPLVRFLTEATVAVLPSKPKPDTVRYWIRGFKERHRGKKFYRIPLKSPRGKKIEKTI
jgi:hypothetical protein